MQNDQLYFIYIMISWFASTFSLLYCIFILGRRMQVYIILFFWPFSRIFPCCCSLHQHLCYFRERLLYPFSSLGTNLYHINYTSNVPFILCLSIKFSIEKFSTSLLVSESSTLFPIKNNSELFLFWSSAY